MRLVARWTMVAVLGLATAGSAAAQNLEPFFQGLGGRSQPRRAAAQAEWERISSAEIACIDSALRRARRSVNSMIARGIGPSDNRVASLVDDCRGSATPAAPNAAVTPSFDCNVASQPDEQTICSNPELARLDRAVVQGYQQVIGSAGADVARGIAEPLLRRRHACGPDIDCIKRTQLTAIAAFQERGSTVRLPAAPQVTARDKPAYVVNGMQLGSRVNVGSADYADYACAPSQQYAGFTGCLRQTAERSRRRRILESAAFLHAADGTAVYINQTLGPVVMDDNDAHDEVDRLSETLGKATLLPLQDARGAPIGLIASWGAVSLLPLEPERRTMLSAGTDGKPEMLIDSLGNLQRSAQLGLPIYRLGGGAGYVLSASWNDRGRGTLRVVAIDASKLPGADEAPSAAPGAAAPVAPAPTAVAASDTSKPVDASQLPAASPGPAAAVPAPAKPADPAPASPAAKLSPPAKGDIRVVGPPIALYPSEPAAAQAAAGPSGGNGLIIFLIALVVVLLGAVGYLWRKIRTGPPASAAAEAAKATGAAVETVDPPESEKMNLPALVPSESPDSVASSQADIEVPKAEAAMTPAADKRSTS